MKISKPVGSVLKIKHKKYFQISFSFRQKWFIDGICFAKETHYKALKSNHDYLLKQPGKGLQNSWWLKQA
jgi:hypothetical protein